MPRVTRSLTIKSYQPLPHTASALGLVEGSPASNSYTGFLLKWKFSCLFGLLGRNLGLLYTLPSALAHAQIPPGLPLKSLQPLHFLLPTDPAKAVFISHLVSGKTAQGSPVLVCPPHRVVESPCKASTGPTVLGEGSKHHTTHRAWELRPGCCSWPLTSPACRFLEGASLGQAAPAAPSPLHFSHP